MFSVGYTIVAEFAPAAQETVNPGRRHNIVAHAAAVANNRRGIARIVNPAANLRLMVLKFDDARTPPLAYFAAKAVFYAAGLGWAARRAHIINASWHVLDDKGLLRKALLFAQARGVLVVCAAGNNGGDNTRIPTIPASYAFDNMIAVAASDRHDNKARFSNSAPPSTSPRPARIGDSPSAHTIARPIPVLPLVASMTVCPGFSCRFARHLRSRRAPTRPWPNPED